MESLKRRLHSLPHQRLLCASGPLSGKYGIYKRVEALASRENSLNLSRCSLFARKRLGFWVWVKTRNRDLRRARRPGNVFTSGKLVYLFWSVSRSRKLVTSFAVLGVEFVLWNSSVEAQMTHSTLKLSNSHRSPTTPAPARRVPPLGTQPHVG